MPDVPDLVHRRYEVLSALDAGAKPKPRIVDATDASRSTVDRAIDELEDHGLVTVDGSEYRTTPTASRALAAYEEFRYAAERYGEASEAVDVVDVDDELPPEILDGADVEVAEPPMSATTIERALEDLECADEAYGVVPVLLAVYDRVINEAVLERGLECDVVFSQEAAQAIEDTYPDRFEEVVSTGRLRANVHDDVPSYNVGVFHGVERAADGSVLNIFTFDGASPKALLTNDSQEAVEWGMSLYRRYEEEARPMRTHQ